MRPMILTTFESASGFNRLTMCLSSAAVMDIVPKFSSILINSSIDKQNTSPFITKMFVLRTIYCDSASVFITNFSFTVEPIIVKSSNVAQHRCR